MKILSSTIDFNAAHQLDVNRQQSENLQVWGGTKDLQKMGNPDPVDSYSANDSVQLSSSAKRLFFQLAKSNHRHYHQPTTGAVTGRDENSIEISPEDQQKLKILEKLWEQLTGKKISLQVVSGKIFQPQSNDNNQQMVTQGAGLEYDYYESYHEQEKMSFNADGVIKTADNQEINFSVELNMSREFYQSLNISVKAGDARLADPLVINYDGSGVGLSAKKFTFDLDSDGNNEKISMLQPGSGFLALDRNNDGVINNGSELFGPQSGSGFQELAALDEDGNQWIDENDSVFDRLRIWSIDESGNSSLFALGEKDIGAIYCGHLDTPFQLKGNQNQLLGQISSSSIYLQEHGAVGIIQQVDLAT